MATSGETGVETYALLCRRGRRHGSFNGQLPRAQSLAAELPKPARLRARGGVPETSDAGLGFQPRAHNLW